ELRNGDIIQLGPHAEMRFYTEVPQPQVDEQTDPKTHTDKQKVPPSVIIGRPLLRELMKLQAIRTVFQPIIDLRTLEVFAHEALGRGTYPELSTRPAELFRLAGRCGMANELSRLFRGRAVADAVTLPHRAMVFCNVHSEELLDLNEATVDRL